jgi:hypothetical protein
MSTREEALAKQTYKQEGPDVARRVFYTLIGEQGNRHRGELQADLNSKAIALLFETLRESGQLTDKQIDKILLDLVG